MYFTLLFYAVCLYIIYRVLDFLIHYPLLGQRLQKHVVITGCDSGFGQAAAKKLDLSGLNVFAGCYTEPGENILKEQCSYRLKTFRLDVSREESIKQGYEFVKAQLPEGRGLWGLVNNAGFSGSYLGPPEWNQVADYKEVMEVNFHGMVNMTRTFLPLLKKVKGSRIVNTSSAWGRMAVPSGTPYCVSKYCVEAYSDIIRRELRPFRVSVHIIEPTVMLTNITHREPIHRAMQRAYDRLDSDIKQMYGENFVKESMDNDYKNFIKSGSPDITPAVDAYEHALMAHVPRARYLIGPSARAWGILSAMPEFVSDWVLDKSNPNKAVPACLKKSL